MADGLRGLVVRLLRVPPEPAAPVGAEQSLRLFRASRRYLGYLRALWAIRWGFILLATGFSVVVIPLAAAGGSHPPPPGFHELFFAIAAVLAPVLAAAMTVSWVVTTLDYEWRWYKVTDRSLRIREGIWAVRELTMTFANIQNLSVSQGPLQRLLGIADLKVQSAGGGGGAHDPHAAGHGESLHVGFFRGVENAEQIRGLMLERLRKLKDAGLGDEPAALAPPAGHGGALPLSSEQLLAAIRDEAALLRAAAELV